MIAKLKSGLLIIVVVLSIFALAGCITPIQAEAQAATGAGTHKITFVYYKAYIYNDHDGTGKGAGEWYFDLILEGEGNTGDAYVSRDGPGWADFSDRFMYWPISPGTTYTFATFAWEEDTTILPPWIPYVDYSSISETVVMWPWPNAAINSWYYANQRVGDVRHYYRFYIENLPPTVESLSGPSTGYRKIEYTWQASGSDAEGDSIDYQWSVDGAYSQLGPDSTFTAAPFDSPGEYVIGVRTKDYFGSWSGWSYKTIRILNLPPTVGPISGPSTGSTGVPYTFSTSGSDPDGDPITYTWSVNTIIVLFITGPTLTWIFPEPGTYTIRVTAKDSYGARSALSSKTVTIVPMGKTDTRVDFTLSPNPASPGEPILFYGTLTDIHGDPVYPAQVQAEYSTNAGTSWHYAWTLNTDSNGEFQRSLSAPRVGTYLLRVSYAGSADYNPSSHTETLVVQTGIKTDTQVSFSLSPNPTNPGVLVRLSGTVRTVDGDPVSQAQVRIDYSVDGGTSWNHVWTLQADSAGEFSRNFSAPSARTYLVRVSYAGSVDYNPSSHTETLTVQ